MTGIVNQALDLAARGWPVFPCKPGHKIPATRHGCHDATTNPEQIVTWWETMPDANVAIATGAPGPDVVDVDRKGDRDGYPTMERLRRAGLLAGPIGLVTTPSGGLHLYYPGSDQGNSSLARWGIDFRGKGGYVLTPPSIIDGRPYQFSEQRNQGQQVNWQRIRRFLIPPHPVHVATGRPENGSIDHLARWVADQTEGNRNEGLYWAAHRALGEGHDDLEPLVTAAIVAGLPETEARATVNSARRKARHA